MRVVALFGVLAVALIQSACDHSPPELDATEVPVLAAESLIYGTDDRTEYLDITDPKWKLRADATAALIGDGGINCDATTCSLTGLRPYNDGDVAPSVSLPLCSSVRFKGQLAEPHCTAFLVGPDTFVTAGHCMVANGKNSPVTCTNPSGGRTRAAFGFNANASGVSPASLPAAQVYSCVAIDGAWDNTADWAVFKVDRIVTGRTPMVVQYSGSLGTLMGRQMVVLGHGLSLPLKMSPNAFVTTDNSMDPVYIESNGDIFGGNSGGPGIDAANGVVLAITEYAPALKQHVAVSDGLGGQCAVPRVCSTATGCPGWSGHTRMTYVAAAATSVRVPLHVSLLTSLPAI